MNKGDQVWFWYKGHDGYDVHTGTIYQWFMEKNYPYKPNVAKIRTGGFSIHLPPERLFTSEQSCITDLREKQLNKILDE